MDHVAKIVASVQEASRSDVPHFVDIFRSAVRRTPPIYFRRRYSDFFWQCISDIPGWLPKVILSCASTEDSGSHSLLDIWSRVDYWREAEAGLLAHAKDESRHARMFLEIGRLAFEQAYADDVLFGYKDCLRPMPSRGAIAKQSECIIPAPELMDYLVQLNIVEMRTRLHLTLLAPAYFSLTQDDEKKGKVAALLESLARDETRHIAYTAGLIEEWAREGKSSKSEMIELYAQRLGDYNAHTVDHCDKALHDYGQGDLPDFIGE